MTMKLIYINNFLFVLKSNLCDNNSENNCARTSRQHLITHSIIWPLLDDYLKPMPVVMFVDGRNRLANIEFRKQAR